MTAEADPAPHPPALAFRIGIRNQVLFVLVIAATVAASTSGFVAVAPNRLVSGRPIALWQAAGGGCDRRDRASSARCCWRFRCCRRKRCCRPAPRCWRRGCCCSLWRRSAIPRASSPPAPARPRGSPPGPRSGSSPSCAALAVVDALQRLRAGPALLVAAVVAIAGGVAALAVRRRLRHAVDRPRICRPVRRSSPPPSPATSPSSPDRSGRRSLSAFRSGSPRRADRACKGRSSQSSTCCRRCRRSRSSAS